MGYSYIWALMLGNIDVIHQMTQIYDIDIRYINSYFRSKFLSAGCFSENPACIDWVLSKFNIKVNDSTLKAICNPKTFDNDGMFGSDFERTYFIDEWTECTKNIFGGISFKSLKHLMDKIEKWTYENYKFCIEIAKRSKISNKYFLYQGKKYDPLIYSLKKLDQTPGDNTKLISKLWSKILIQHPPKTNGYFSTKEIINVNMLAIFREYLTNSTTRLTEIFSIKAAKFGSLDEILQLFQHSEKLSSIKIEIGPETLMTAIDYDNYDLAKYLILEGKCALNYEIACFAKFCEEPSLVELIVEKNFLKNLDIIYANEKARSTTKTTKNKCFRRFKKKFIAESTKKGGLRIYKKLYNSYEDFLLEDQNH
jgi:hypothetical protein